MYYLSFEKRKLPGSAFQTFYAAEMIDILCQKFFIICYNNPCYEDIQYVHRSSNSH